MKYGEELDPSTYSTVCPTTCSSGFRTNLELLSKTASAGCACVSSTVNISFIILFYFNCSGKYTTSREVLAKA